MIKDNKDIKNLGQVWTPQNIVSEMLSLRKNSGNILEPSIGAGAFFNNIPNCVGIEIDKQYCQNKNILNIDFFDYSIENKFDTIIGNPPYVRAQDINPETKKKLSKNIFDERSNLYLFFIEKCIRHLKDNGELIFITPRDFLKATSSIKLNNFIYQNGTITDLIDLGDKKIFADATPNCIIFRFEKKNFSRKTNIHQEFVCANGQLLFTNNNYPISFSDVFYVKVGAVSGNDEIFTNDKYGNEYFVCSRTCKDGYLRKMIFNRKIKYLEEYKDILINRKIKSFTEEDWYKWGRMHYVSDNLRIYVNSKTRIREPFFLNDCLNYDGSVLAIFPKNNKINKKDLEGLKDMLNKVNWNELGFICDGRFIFSQKSLENTILPESFRKYIIKDTLDFDNFINPKIFETKERELFEVNDKNKSKINIKSKSKVISKPKNKIEKK